MTTIPNIQTLYSRIIAYYQSNLGVLFNPLTKTFLVPMAGVFSVLLWLVYIAIGDVQKNVWYDTADSIANGGTLERFGNSILGRLPFGATPAQLTATVTGATGATIPANTVFKADDNSKSPGKRYQIYGGAYTLSGTTGTITIIALEGGTGSALIIGNTLTSTSPIINVNSSITVTSIVEDPVDAEDIEEYRTKIGEKIQEEPGSWSAVDYRLVGLDVAGIKQVYAYPSPTNNNEMDVYLQGETPIANPGPSVSPTVIDNYQDAIDLVKPATVWQVNTHSCPINNVDVTIAMGTFPAFSLSQKSAIESALTSFINNIRPFIAAADKVADRNDTIATYNMSETVSQAVPGYGFSGITFTVAGTPVTKWQADNGNILFLNSITYA